MKIEGDKSRGRKVAEGIGVGFTLVVLGISSVVAIASHWINSALLDSAHVRDTTTSILKKPSVVDAMSTFMTDEIVRLYKDNESLVDQLPREFKDEGKFVEQLVEKEIKAASVKVVSSDLVQTLITDLVTGTHESALDVATNSGSAEPSGVTLDLIPVVSDIALKLQEQGLIPEKAKLPTDLISRPADEQRDQLAKALKIELPKEISSVEVISAEDMSAQSGAVETLRSILDVTSLVRWMSTLVALAGVLIIVLVSNPRYRSVWRLGPVFVVAGVVGVIASRFAPNAGSLTDDPVASAAISDGIGVLADEYMRWNAVITVAAVLVMVTAVLTRRWAGTRELRTNGRSVS